MTEEETIKINTLHRGRKPVTQRALMRETQARQKLEREVIELKNMVTSLLEIKVSEPKTRGRPKKEEV